MESTMMEKVPMTADGYNAMIDEVKHLKSVERPRIIRAIEEARAHGDLSENAEYHAAKEAQGWNEARVAELEDKISRAEVIDVSKLSGDTVKFGAKVTLIDEDTEAKVIYQIVGDSEADVKKGAFPFPRPSRAPSSASARATASKWLRPAAASPTRSTRSRGADRGGLRKPTPLQRHPVILI